MPLRLAGLIALAVTAALLISVMRARNRNNDTAPPGDELLQERAVSTATPKSRAQVPRLLGAEAPAAAVRLGYLHGRVLGAPETTAPFEELEVDASDGRRRFPANVHGDGTFELHLPPAILTVTARLNGLVGAVKGVEVVAGADREVVITLGEGASIRGTVRWGGPRGGSVSVTATSPHHAEDVTDTVDESGRFELTGLVPQVGYQLMAEGEQLRPVIVPGLVPPLEGVELLLQPVSVLRGAIGPDRNGDCPVHEIEVRPENAPQDEIETHEVDHRCRFEADLPHPPGTRLRVEAANPGWHLTAAVQVPAHGDPPEICLNPPCGGRVTERGAIEAVVEGHAIGWLQVTVRARRLRAHLGCATREGGSCVVEDVPAGKPVVVSARTRGCGELPNREVLLHPGRRIRVVFPCRPLRDVIAILRGGAPDPAELFVRCGEREHTATGRKVITLLCPRDAERLEYRTGPETSWRSVRFPPGPAEETALVELRLP
jgi:hypothetical protein